MSLGGHLTAAGMDVLGRSDLTAAGLDVLRRWHLTAAGMDVLGRSDLTAAGVDVLGRQHATGSGPSWPSPIKLLPGVRVIMARLLGVVTAENAWCFLLVFRPIITQLWPFGPCDMAGDSWGGHKNGLAVWLTHHYNYQAHSKIIPGKLVQEMVYTLTPTCEHAGDKLHCRRN